MSSIRKINHITWGHEYSSGLDYLDNHRKIFIGIVNELIDIVNNDTCESDLPIILHRMAFHVENYFVNKEVALMGNSSLPLKVYKHQHHLFTDEVSKYQQEFNSGNRRACRSLLEFIIPWFENYIRLFSSADVEYMRSRGFK